MSTAAVPLPPGTAAADVFAALDAAEDHVFWLDAGPQARAGWSFVGVGAPEADSARVRAVRVDRPRPPSPGAAFRGGWVGWIGYERGAAAAGAPVHASTDAVPDELWLRVDALVAIEHATGAATAVGAPDAAAALAERLRGLQAAEAPSAPAESRVAQARCAPDVYAEMVQECRRRIREGDAYQLCLTTRFHVAGAVDPALVYARLRAASPSHHGGLIRSGPLALASASPERFLEIAHATVRTHPIKGTRPRGSDEAADAALAAELVADPKERAENVMIVDLMRNDLARVGRPGSVSVERLLEVESYPAVHQLVSSVSVRVAEGTTLGDVLRATFPAGSMTGAPKLSAMTILHALEAAPRGLFAGCFGWVGDDGAADLAMVIRSIVSDGEGAYVGAGGGVTWLSRPEAEVAEVALKARAPLAALGASLPSDWRR